MSRFINVREEHINADAIQSFCVTDRGAVQVELEDGTARNAGAESIGALIDELTGAKHVIQVIPCAEPLWTVWNSKDGTHVADRVAFLGLCADGELRALILCDGCFEIEGLFHYRNGYIGVYHERDLEQFANLVRNEKSATT